MRKLLLVLTMLMVASWGLNADELVLKMGMNSNDDMNLDWTFVSTGIYGEYKESGTEEFEMQSNYSVSLEYYFDISEKFYLGFGASFENEIEGEDESDENESEVRLMPVYLTGKYKFNPESRAVFYMGMDLGYTIINTKNLDSADEKGGLYLGGSLGIEYSNFIAEVKYSQLNIGIDYEDTWNDEEYKEEDKYKMSRVSLNVGYKFEI